MRHRLQEVETVRTWTRCEFERYAREEEVLLIGRGNIRPKRELKHLVCLGIFLEHKINVYENPKGKNEKKRRFWQLKATDAI